MPGHPPAQARALAQESRSGQGRPVAVLLEEARAIADPSFAAEALFALSQDGRLPLDQAAKVLGEVVQRVAATERAWRRAEALGELARRAGKWRDGHPAAQSFLSDLVDLALSLPDGEALSAGIHAVAPWAPASRRAELLRKAVGNRGFELEDAKEVLRRGPDTRLSAVLHACPDPALRARLLAFLHVHAPGHLLHEALQVVGGIPAAERSELLRGIVASLERQEDLEAVALAVPQEPEPAARLLAALAARADKLGDRRGAQDRFRQAADVAAGIEDPRARSAVRRNLAQGLDRAGAADEARALLELSRAEAPERPARPAQEPVAAAAAPAPAGEARHWLALYDTYEGGLKEAHLRAVARAAPLCQAFGLDLALYGFPSTLEATVAQAARETQVGGGRALRELEAAGRIHWIACDPREPPKRWDGFPVATTSEPRADKEATLEQALERARAVGQPRVILLVGLGPRGLPASLVAAVPAHHELTGKRIGLETATAMGILADRLGRLPLVR